MTATTLAPMDVAGRVPRLRDLLDGAGCDGLLVTSLVHVRYLTGFTGSAAYLAVTPTSALLVTDGRYRDQAADQLRAAGVDAAVAWSLAQSGQRDLVREGFDGAGRVGLEAGWVTWSQQRSFAGEWFADRELVATEGLVEGLRRTKDAGEVARIERAASIADDALAATLPMLRLTGISERAFGLALDQAMRERGAGGPSFETIVASGPNAAKPHHRPSPRVIERGEAVVLDFGATVDGYCSDMTRTVSLGPPADPVVARMREVVAESQAAGAAAVGPGVAATEVDATCRAVIADAGWGDAFLHGTGHGVGLLIHEDPRVSSVSTATLAPGDVVTVEPGVYLPAHGGVRIEDTLVVTDDGARPLTGFDKRFVIED